MIGHVRYFLRLSPPQRRRQFVGLCALIIFSGFIELAALGALAAFITSLSAPEAVLTSRAALLAQKLIGPWPFASAQRFYIVLGAVTVLLVVAKNLFTICHNYAAARFDGALNVDFGVRMLDAFLSQPYANTLGTNSADTIQTICWKAHVGALISCLTTVMSDGVISLLMLLSLFLLEPVVTLCVAALLGGIGLLTFRIFRSRAMALGDVILQQSTGVSILLMKSVQGVRDIKLFNAEDEAVASLKSRQEALVRNLAAQRMYERAAVWVLETVGMGGLVLGAILLIVSGTVSSAQMMGTLSLVAVTAWRILPAIYRGVAAIGTARSYAPFLDAVRTFIDRQGTRPEASRSRKAATLPPLARAIEIRGLRLRYAGAAQDALSGLDLTVRQGEMLGIIGRSGAGKSSLADVLTGLIEPSAGQILIDGRPLERADQAAWRAQVGLVPQSPYLFEGTLAENIAFSLDAEDIDEARVRECCVQSGVQEFLTELPGGIHANIGERACLLSGGQAQRVAIARALYRRPSVLIFDEATSALDSGMERLIQETILRLRGQNTIIIIAHKPSAVQHCDRVVLLEGGRVAGEGAPAAMLARHNDALAAAAGSPAPDRSHP